MNQHTENPTQCVPWSKGKLVGQKTPLRVSEIWAIRVRLEIYGRVRDLAPFNLAVDSKLRGCDLATSYSCAYKISPTGAACPAALR
jgi:hypothetical protein